MDAVFAILLLELTSSSEQQDGEGHQGGGSLLLGAGCQATDNLLHNSFPDDPNAYYLSFCQSVLCGLGLQDIWQQVSSGEEL